VAVITTIITLFFITWAYSMFEWALRRPQTMPGLGLPLWISQASIAMAAVGCFAYAVRDAVSAGMALIGRRS
jgi:TRAP-type C4-dicarboxylate transport system permease small subunit